ncbi:MAG: Ribosomal large subunit pseudouridine synthase B [Syntrophorhabdaceae bacterium PtaU1.Bin034]|nr:MAG: Ribosomal large subunit pseudouridine synthase B [Syntrophorhabdaceae bacterium PtaU1.Bin034]
MPLERLSKFLAQTGVASRRKSDDIIRSGRVKVNGRVIVDPFHHVDTERDSVTFGGKKLTLSTHHRYVALYKPIGYISDLADPKGRPIARHLIKLPGHLFPVGRLDYNSEGLMLFTDDGEFANLLMHPRYEVEKEYLVKFSGRLTEDHLRRMMAGVPVEGRCYRAKHIAFVRYTTANAWYRITVTEGRYRMIRKMAEALSHPVLKLKRVRIDGIVIGQLKPGEYVHIDPSKVRQHLGRVSQHNGAPAS